MTVKRLILAFVAAALGVPSTLVLAQGVKACELLTRAEVQAVAGYRYRADNPKTGAAMAYLKGKILSVVYEAPDAPAKKDQVIGLLKLAASRL